MSELGRRDPRNLQSLSCWGSITCWTVSIERKDRIKEVNFYFYVVNCLSKYLSRSWTMNCLVITLEEDKRFWCVWLPIHNIFRPLLYLPVEFERVVVEGSNLPVHHSHYRVKLIQSCCCCFYADMFSVLTLK